jgi:hypothetical protein
MLHGFIIYHCPLGSGKLSTVTFHRTNFFQFSYQTRYDISSRSAKKSVIFCTFAVPTIHVAQDICNNKHILLSCLRQYIYNSCGQSIIWICRKAFAENSVILDICFFPKSKAIFNDVWKVILLHLQSNFTLNKISLRSFETSMTVYQWHEIMFQESWFFKFYWNITFRYE